MHALRIIAVCILAAVCYGVVHDQITARVSLEYFTIGHAPIFGTHDPTLLALGWGVLSTWWAGLFLGVALALACRFGSWPKKTLAEVLPSIGRLLIVMAIGALVAGLIGWFLASQGWIILIDHLASVVPREKQVAFLAVGAAHMGSYALAFLGGAVIVARVVLSRSRAARGVAKAMSLGG
jgi:hypothetical protein